MKEPANGIQCCLATAARTTSRHGHQITASAVQQPPDIKGPSTVKSINRALAGFAKPLRQRFTPRSSLLTMHSGTVCPRESAVLGTRRSPIPSPGQGRTQDRHQAGREDPTDGPVTSNAPWISRRRGRSSHGHFVRRADETILTSLCLSHSQDSRGVEL